MTREEQIYNAAKENLQEVFGCRKFCRYQGDCDICDGHIPPYKLNECSNPADYCRDAFIQGAQWADQHPVNPWKDEEIKKELKLISEWFDHIAQIADDRKTLNGFVMSDSNALVEIRCLAKDSADYIRTILL